ncbi:MAG: hypothetical protein M3Z26_11405 [Bacteroidota bacterium]|nr:hypothetical protein [Bacteroidota bacterium]
MSTITLKLPADIDKELSELTIRKEEYLLEALREKMRSEKIANLDNLLIEGYKERKKENELLGKDFFHTDLEHWNEY